MDFNFEEQLKDKQTMQQSYNDREKYPIDEAHCGSCPYLSPTCSTTLLFGAPNYVSHSCTLSECKYKVKHIGD